MNIIWKPRRIQYINLNAQAEDLETNTRSEYEENTETRKHWNTETLKRGSAPLRKYGFSDVTVTSYFNDEADFFWSTSSSEMFDPSFCSS